MKKKLKRMSPLSPRGRPYIEEDFIRMNSERAHDAVSTCIEMMNDLDENGRKSKFIRSLKGLPIFELKSSSRGGFSGGARLYFFWLGDAIIVLCAAEYKEGKEVDRSLLKRAEAIYWEVYEEVRRNRK